jgi:hypothetical protein
MEDWRTRRGGGLALAAAPPSPVSRLSKRAFVTHHRAMASTDASSASSASAAHAGAHGAGSAVHVAPLKGISLHATAAGAHLRRVGIVHTQWNREVVDALVNGAIGELQAQGVSRENILVVSVRFGPALAAVRCCERWWGMRDCIESQRTDDALTRPARPYLFFFFCRCLDPTSFPWAPSASWSRAAWTPCCAWAASSRARRCTSSTFARPSRRRVVPQQQHSRLAFTLHTIAAVQGRPPFARDSTPSDDFFLVPPWLSPLPHPPPRFPSCRRESCG